MKNVIFKLRPLFLMFAGIFIVFSISACSGISESETASVSFSLSPELAKAVLSASRAADDATDAEATGTDGTSTEPTAQEDEQNTKPYRIEVSMSGAVSSTQTKTYSESEWSAIAAGKGKKETFTFNDIPVGSELSVSATIYLDRGGHLVWPYMTGSSAIKISAGENLVPVNVHKLARVKIYNNTGTGEVISDISKLDVYALSETSSTGIFELLGSETASSDIDSEIYGKLSSEARIYSYSNPDSPYLTGGYELKNGTCAYMFTLLYTNDGEVYVGYPSLTHYSELTPDTQYTLTTISIDEINNIHLYLKKLDLDYTYIFPAKYAGKTVSAWYVGENIDENADYNGKVAVTKTEYSATFLFSDGTFVVTSHSKKVDSSGTVWKEKIHYVMRGTYEVSRGNFETGLLALNPTAVYEANDNSNTQGWLELSAALMEQYKMECEVSSGSFTPPSEQMEEPYPFYKKADDAYLRVYRGEIDDSKSSSQYSGDDPETALPESFDIQFLFQKEKGGTEYEEKSELTTFHCSESTSMDFDSIISGYTMQAILLGYDFNEQKSDEEPVYVNGTWLIRVYFDIAEIQTVFTATSTSATDSNNATSKYTQTGFTLTVYNNLTYVVTYSNESGTITNQIVSKGTYADVTGSDTSITVTETEYFDFVNTDDMSSLASGKHSLQTVNSPTDQTIDFSDGSFSVTCAGGVTITFTFSSSSSSTAGISVTLENFDETNFAEQLSVSSSVSKEDGSITVTVTGGESLPSVAYQWFLDSKAVDGATASSYIWTADMISKLNSGHHDVMVTITVNGNSYSATGGFTITKTTN